ncbi:MAG TPA: WGR domain-containing protein [Chloroflexia bacterium]|nr:WGR domain-containing protein [Chloroflexia bacterium]
MTTQQTGSDPTQPDAISTSPNTDAPAERMMYQLTDLTDNHNKFYMVELWPQQDGSVLFRATWGRVGTKPQVKEKSATRREVERQIGEKVRKGYRRVELHEPAADSDSTAGSQPDANVPQIHPTISQLVEWVFSEAGEHIQSYLAVPVDALSQAQVAEGRRLLAQAQNQLLHYRINPFRREQNLESLSATIQAYYNSIPTRLPARIDREEVVKRFCNEFSEQEERLNQLEAAISTLKEKRLHPNHTRYQMLGARLAVLSAEDEVRVSLLDYIKRTQAHGYEIKVRDVFEVEIPAERSAYEANKRGTSHRELLFHGTHTRNVRHILRSGLICPKAPSNGRMLGNGIYLANKSTKSTNYCSSSKRDVPKMLLVVEAALGKRYEAPTAQVKEPPRGYDSVWGKAGHTRLAAQAQQTLLNDEFVIYSPAQQTIRYLVTFDR